MMKNTKSQSKRQAITLLFLLYVFLPINGKSQSPCKEVIGYYPGWQWYDRTKLVNPETIDYSKYTILNYAFLYPLADGTITVTDPWGDKNLLLGQINWSVAPPGYDSSYDLGNPEYHHSNTSLIYHAHLNDVKVMISLGGWTLSNDFPAIAADPTKRANFAHSCNELVRIYDIDGIDIDWEYPGYEPHAGTPDDIYNYTLLLQEIRDSLDVVEEETSKNLLLTAAFGAAPDRMDDIEWDEMVEILDYINLMSYDFFGAFSPLTNHNSPLYAPEVGDGTFNCHSAIDRLLNDYDVPSEMINLGVAFYGRSAQTTGTPGLHVETTGSADMATFAADEGTPQYYNIMANMDLFNREWDDLAQVPYLTGEGGLQTFVSYDDEESIGLKGQFIVDRELAGAIIWEITGDYMETSPGSGVIAGTPLADTLNKALCHAPTDTDDEPSDVSISEQQMNTIQLFPNPTNDLIQVNIPADQTLKSIQVFTMDGQQVLSTSNDVISLEALENGLYLFIIKTTDNTITKRVIKQ